jgi:glucan biosynthesis protein
VPAPNPFRYEEVVRRARELAGPPHDPTLPPLPEPFNRLDFDAYRDIRFRPDRALLASRGGPFRMHLFHLGFPVSAPRHRERDPRGRADAGALSARIVRLRAQRASSGRSP